MISVLLVLGALGAPPAWALDNSVCLQSAANAGIPRTQTLRLCKQSASAAPVSCFQQARDSSGLSAENSIQLCQCAQDDRAADCVKEYINQLHKGVQEALLTCEDPGARNLAERRCFEADKPNG